MGIKIGNTFVKCDRREKVVEAVRHLLPRNGTDHPHGQLATRQSLPSELLDLVNKVKAPEFPAAYVSSNRNGWIGVFEESLEGTTCLAPDLAVALSRELQTVAISFHIWDGEHLRYCLAQNGQLLDEFSQDPDDRAESPGRPAVLARVCGIPASSRTLQRLLRARAVDPLDTLTALTKELGICDAHLSYRYFERDIANEVPGSPAYVVIQRQELIGDHIQHTTPRPRSAVQTGPARLPVESVAMNACPVGCFALSGQFFAFLGRNGRAMLIKDMLLTLHESDGMCECTIWFDDVPPDPLRLWTAYVSAPDDERRATFIDELAENYRAVQKQHTCLLPTSAVPVAKRTTNGTITRFWPAPGPKVPAKQRVTVEWATFTVLNRCFDLGERGAKQVR